MRVHRWRGDGWWVAGVDSEAQGASKDSGCGFPGVDKQVSAPSGVRVCLTDHDSYAANVAAIIAKAQINNGGKVIFYQPESEYR